MSVLQLRKIDDIQLTGEASDEKPERLPAGYCAVKLFFLLSEELPVATDYYPIWQGQKETP